MGETKGSLCKIEIVDLRIEERRNDSNSNSNSKSETSNCQFLVEHPAFSQQFTQKPMVCGGLLKGAEVFRQMKSKPDIEKTNIFVTKLHF